MHFEFFPHFMEANSMYDYLYLIPFGIIYTILFWIITPQIEGKWVKFIIIVLLIPVAYLITGYVDQYLPTLLYKFIRLFQF